MTANRDRGQAAVEFAIALPLVAVLVLGVVQVIVVARDQIAVELAAREGARAAAVAAAPGSAATDAAHAAVRLRPLDIATTSNGEVVVVTVSYASNTSVPLVGAFIGDVTLTATVTMAREPP